MTTDKVTRAADYLESALRAKRISAASAARMAGLTPAQGRNLFSGRELPTRDQALRIALSMAMRPDEANRLLRLTGNEPLMQDEARDSSKRASRYKKRLSCWPIVVSAL